MIPSVSVRLLLTQSDERLVGYARAGHERAFEALVQRYRRQLHAYCRRLLLSEERAEDALQQALLQAWVALRDGADVRDVRPWLYRIVHNAAVNALRVSGYDYCKLSESLSGADAPQADLDRRIAVREALAGLAALPQMQREALLRTAVEGRSHRQVAGDLGVSEPALRGLVYRARTALRAAAGAIVPPPLLGWALEAGTRGTPALERVAGLGAGGGSAGLAGLLVKGGAVAVTAGALAGGLVATHDRRAQARAARTHTHAHTTTSPAAASASGSVRPASFTQPTGAARPLPHPSGRGLGGQQRVRGQRSFGPSPTWPVHPHGDGGSQQGEGSHPTFAAHAGEGSGGSSSHDSQSTSSGGSGSGSGEGEQQAGGGSEASSGGSTGQDVDGASGSGKDGSGDPSGQTSSSEPSASKDGGTSGGSGDLQLSQSTSGGDGASGTKDEPSLVEGSSKPD